VIGAPRRRAPARNTAIACSSTARIAVACALLYGLAMQQRLTLSIVALAAAAPLTIAHADSSTTTAAPPPPSIGVGLARALDGTSGLSLRYGRGVQLELVLGGQLQRLQWGPDVSDDTQSRIDVGARVLLPLVRRERGWVGAVLGVTGHRYRSARGSTFTGAAEAGIHAEWFVAPALSLGFEVGTSVAYVPDGDGLILPNGWWTDGGVSSNTGTDRLAGAASVTYWLDAEDSSADPRPAGVRFGVGATRSVGTSGLAVAADVGRLRLELTGSRWSIEHFDTSYTATAGAVGALYELARRGPVALATGLRLGGARSTSNLGDSSWTLTGEVPVRLELDATSWLSLHGEGGVSVTTLGDDPASPHVAQLTGPDIAGRVGFTVWL
jgi:hypothetical protein